MTYVPTCMQPSQVMDADELRARRSCAYCKHERPSADGMVYERMYPTSKGLQYGHEFWCDFVCILLGLEPDGHA